MILDHFIFRHAHSGLFRRRFCKGKTCRRSRHGNCLEDLIDLCLREIRVFLLCLANFHYEFVQFTFRHQQFFICVH